jgi:hypothetical protein
MGHRPRICSRSLGIATSQRELPDEVAQNGVRQLVLAKRNDLRHRFGDGRGSLPDRQNLIVVDPHHDRPSDVRSG